MTITEAGIKSGSILIYATHPSPDLPKSEESFGNLQQNYFKAVSSIKNHVGGVHRLDFLRKSVARVVHRVGFFGGRR